MQLEEGRYGFTFFWQAYGEGEGGEDADDYLSVFLVREANWGTTCVIALLRYCVIALEVGGYR